MPSESISGVSSVAVSPGKPPLSRHDRSGHKISHNHQAAQHQYGTSIALSPTKPVGVASGGRTTVDYSPGPQKLSIIGAVDKHKSQTEAKPSKVDSPEPNQNLSIPKVRR